MLPLSLLLLQVIFSNPLHDGLLEEECPKHGESHKTGVLVYGGTAGGVIAAVSAARAGSTVTIMAPSAHLGGMVSSGLGCTDGGPSGGISAEFFKRVGGKQFAPSAAEKVFNTMAAEANITVIFNCPVSKVSKDGTLVSSLTSMQGGEVSAEVVIDASYEGDVMALAGVPYTVGRESKSQFNESPAGRLSIPPVWGCGCNWQFDNVSGVDEQGNPLPMVTKFDGAPLGTGDHRVQAYNFRLCFTKDPLNRRVFPAPKSYNTSQWELLRRVFLSATQNNLQLDVSSFFGIRDVGNNKTDVNNGGGLSTDYVGASYMWPTANYSERALIFDDHKEYTLGLIHFLLSDTIVPTSLKTELGQWGLCADEFLDTDGWPHQLYVREARRMLSDFIFTLHDRTTNKTKMDSVCVGDYNVDAHMQQRILLPDGTVTNEGCLSGWAKYSNTPLGPFEIPYRVMVPPHNITSNLLVTAAVSATHTGSASLRLEPQYMNMGEAAGVAASLVTKRRSSSVYTVNVTILQELLVNQGVNIHAGGAPESNGYQCYLKRCVGSDHATYNTPSCHAACQGLGTNEWIGSVGAWDFHGNQAVATRDTHLKKSLLPSTSLPPSQVRAVSKGSSCTLSEINNATLTDYFLCVV
eukprot:m.40512 g.40512  ORF g.40512 m.40512 type:complete len:634 (+) comp9672_c0_seq1:172-2073(+)